MVARREEMQEIITKIALADRSSLAVKKLWRTRVELAGTQVWMPFLVMPTMLDRVILGMDFLAAMGTRIQCGGATLKVKLSPSAEDPRLRPSKIDLMSSEDTNPEALEGWRTTVPETQKSGDKGTTCIMRQMTTSGVRNIGYGGDDIRRCDEPGRALKDFRPDKIVEPESGDPMTEEDDLRPDQREFITRELAFFEELQVYHTWRSIGLS
ncbi:uncharacterized protein LOC119562264 [Drosophila subpulchrella]|uniref:uncharacterized protein LOC119562264 n=1 Tax=Drosophila subpulchrella TaxID=1486046 RepID=UPI0018A17C3C|nr:uncharacterized protein LOC119562264 [Drosophila subpulchrella]